MAIPKKVRLIAIALTAAAATGCGGDQIFCAGVGLDGIVAHVRNTADSSVIAGATIVVREGAFADTVGPIVPYPGSRARSAGHVGLVENRGGDYVVTASKPHWTSDTVAVRVPGGSCGFVVTQTAVLRIDPLPGAPRVRSVAISPRHVRFGSCGSAAEAYAYVDAASADSAGVTWESANPAVATVDQNGMVIVRSRGVAEIRARAVADTSVFGVMIAQVDPVCPA